MGDTSTVLLATMDDTSTIPLATMGDTNIVTMTTIGSITMTTENDLISIYILVMFIIAIILVILFSCLEKRKSYRLNVLNGRPSMPTPMPFLDGFTKRAEYVVVSIILATTVFQLLYTTTTSTVPTWARAFLFFVGALAAVLITAPIGLALTSFYRLVGSVLGFIYIAAYFTLYVMLIIANNEQTADTFSYLPMLIGCCLLMGIFAYQFYISIKTRKYVVKELSICHPHQELYALQVLRVPTVNRPDAPRFQWLRYSTRPDFLYPVNILVPVTISVVIVYQIAVQFISKADLIYEPFKSLTNGSGSAHTTADIIVYNWYIATVVSAVLAYFNIYVFLRKYRKHILKMYSGNPGHMISIFKKTSPISIMSWSLRFKGYFMGYTLLGFLFSFVVTWLVLSVIIAGGYVLNQNDKLTTILSTVGQTLVLPVLMYILFALQNVLTRFFFLQPKFNPDDKFQPLNVNNRRSFEFISYCWMFVNLTVGLFSGVLKMSKGAFIGIYMVGSLERPILSRGLEQCDKGFFSYVSMLYVDVAHNHPILRVFIKLLWGPLVEYKELKYEAAISRAKIRWFLAYTLINNPRLTEYRKNKQQDISDPPDEDVELLELI